MTDRTMMTGTEGELVHRVLRLTTLAAVALVGATALVACSDDHGGHMPPAAGSGPVDRPSSTGVLTIRSPETGEVVEGTTVDVRVTLRGASIVPQTTTELAPDEGHLHVLLDDELISMTEGLEQEISDLEPGPHRLTVEFVAADHVPFDPRVVAVVQFEVAT
ncbi:MAG: hypothetical protein ACXWDS_01010 [Actinomycetota bacterium]